jgi:hypothetical protein
VSADNAATKTLQDAGFFQDRDTYLDIGGHIHAEGKDKSLCREAAFRRWKNRCSVCNRRIDPSAEKWNPNAAAWHHPKSCDCVDCTEIRCDTTTGRPCHSHGTVGFVRNMLKKSGKTNEKEMCNRKPGCRRPARHQGPCKSMPDWKTQSALNVR